MLFTMEAKNAQSSDCKMWPYFIHYIFINKSFTLLSITMKWINLFIKKIRRLHLHKIAFNLVPQQLFCTKKISGSQGKET